MLLQQIHDEKELKDGRIYLCCRSSRHGNAIWETLEAQNHLILYRDLKMTIQNFDRIYDLPKQMADL